MSIDGMDGYRYQSDSTRINRLQISLVTQLFQVGTTANHIDELLQWLAYALIDHFDIQLIQFWICYANRMGQLAVQLRTMVSQDPSLPVQVVVNDQVALVVQRVANERQPSRLLAVDHLFLQYQAALLKRYGLNYCMSGFMNKDVLIPSMANGSSQIQTPTLFSMTSLLLFRQPPHLDLLPAVNIILNQMVQVSSNRGLLLPTAGFSSPLSPPALVLPGPDVLLAELIPHRKQDPNLLMSSNPFASSTAIADKRARRFFSAVDGHTNISTLCNTLHLDMQDAYAILELLLVQHRIELYGVDGRIINPSRLFKNL